MGTETEGAVPPGIAGPGTSDNGYPGVSSAVSVGRLDRGSVALLVLLAAGRARIVSASWPLDAAASAPRVSWSWAELFRVWSDPLVGAEVGGLQEATGRLIAVGLVRMARVCGVEGVELTPDGLRLALFAWARELIDGPDGIVWNYAPALHGDPGDGWPDGMAPLVALAVLQSYERIHKDGPPVRLDADVSSVAELLADPLLAARALDEVVNAGFAERRPARPVGAAPWYRLRPEWSEGGVWWAAIEGWAPGSRVGVVEVGGGRRPVGRVGGAGAGSVGVEVGSGGDPSGDGGDAVERRGATGPGGDAGDVGGGVAGAGEPRPAARGGSADAGAGVGAGPGVPPRSLDGGDDGGDRDRVYVGRIVPGDGRSAAFIPHPPYNRTMGLVFAGVRVIPRDGRAVVIHADPGSLGDTVLDQLVGGEHRARVGDLVICRFRVGVLPVEEDDDGDGVASERGDVAGVDVSEVGGGVGGAVGGSAGGDGDGGDRPGPAVGFAARGRVEREERGRAGEPADHRGRFVGALTKALDAFIDGMWP